MKNIIGFFAGLFLVGMAGMASAAYVVDTGTGTGVGAFLNTNQWLAAEFSVEEPVTVTSIEAYFQASNGLTVTAIIYDDGGDGPGLNSLYDITFTPGTSPDEWYGAFGLSWDLVKDETYWLAFEVKDGSETFSGSIRRHSENPLINEAYWTPGNGYWSSSDNMDLAVRIGVIPIPGSIWILCFGLIGLAHTRRTR